MALSGFFNTSRFLFLLACPWLCPSCAPSPRADIQLPFRITTILEGQLGRTRQLEGYIQGVGYIQRKHRWNPREQ